MRKTISNVALVIGAWAFSCAATSPAPYYYECRTVDRIFQTALKAPSAQRDALLALELIGAGRIDTAKADLEAHVGLKPGELRTPAFSAATVRAHALRRIGETALPEAMTFLESLKASDLAADTTGMVWPAAQIALRDARLRQIPDAQLKVRFLEDILTGMRDGRGQLADWAVNELCDRGSVVSAPVVSQSIRSRGNGLRDEEDLEFCEARIRAVTSNPDPVKAFGSILDVQGDIGDVQRGLNEPRRRLVGWAVNKLNSMQSASADAELDRFARQIEALPEGPRKAGLAEYHRSILDAQAQRAVR